MADEIQMISAAYGSGYVATGAAEKTFTHPAFAFEAWEDTTITEFKDADDTVVTTGWESVVIPEGKTVYFGQAIKKMTVSIGGKGQVFYSNAE